jgi:hypothetical protein
LLPPISSPLGSIFGSARQIAPSSRSPGSSIPRPAISHSPAPYRSTLSSAGVSSLVPPISSPVGSIFGSARRNHLPSFVLDSEPLAFNLPILELPDTPLFNIYSYFVDMEPVCSAIHNSVITDR